MINKFFIMLVINEVKVKLKLKSTQNILHENSSSYALMNFFVEYVCNSTNKYIQQFKIHFELFL